jgi:hypothetical protein
MKMIKDTNSQEKSGARVGLLRRFWFEVGSTVPEKGRIPAGVSGWAKTAGIGRTWYFLACGVLAALLVVGCGKKSDSPASSSPSGTISGPFPLKVGNIWNYKLTANDTSGVALAAPQDFVYQITKDTAVFNEQWYCMSGALYYVNRSDGVWRVFNGIPVLFFKYPAKPNDSYSSSLGRIRVLSIDTGISVPKGTFHCYQYRLSQANGSQFDYYFLEGIVIARIDVFEQTLSGRTYIMSQYLLSGYTI